MFRREYKYYNFYFIYSSDYIDVYGRGNTKYVYTKNRDQVIIRDNDTELSVIKKESGDVFTVLNFTKEECHLTGLPRLSYIYESVNDEWYCYVDGCDV